MSHGDQAVNTPTRMLEPLETVTGVCRWLGISRPTLYRLVRAGELHPARVGERLRFERGDVRDYLQRNQGGDAA